MDWTFSKLGMPGTTSLSAILSILSHPLPGTDRCLLGKVEVSLGKKTFYVRAGLAERILEVIVLV